MIFYEFGNVLSGQFYYQEREISQKILRIFHEFIKTKFKGSSKEKVEKMVAEIPYFYNDFIFATMEK